VVPTHHRVPIITTLSCLTLLSFLGLWVDHLVLLHGMVRGANGGEVERRAWQHLIHGEVGIIYRRFTQKLVK
jgi:hypothetical protein